VRRRDVALLELAHAWIELEDRLEAKAAQWRNLPPLHVRRRSVRCANA
jgi:hypothetical protein